jgi:hypothetical protein
MICEYTYPAVCGHCEVVCTKVEPKNGEEYEVLEALCDLTGKGTICGKCPTTMVMEAMK